MSKLKSCTPNIQMDAIEFLISLDILQQKVTHFMNSNAKVINALNAPKYGGLFIPSLNNGL
jgi:hypothetical protein